MRGKIGKLNRLVPNVIMALVFSDLSAVAFSFQHFPFMVTLETNDLRYYALNVPAFFQNSLDKITSSRSFIFRLSKSTLDLIQNVKNIEACPAQSKDSNERNDCALSIETVLDEGSLGGERRDRRNESVVFLLRL